MKILDDHQRAEAMLIALYGARSVLHTKPNTETPTTTGTLMANKPKQLEREAAPEEEAKLPRVLKTELAFLDIDICEKHHEITRLQNELDVLERRHHEVLTQLRKGAT
jgi:hypothetical protein